MRLLVLSNFFPPHHFGGYELSCRDVVDGLRTRGHDALVLTSTVRVPGVDDPASEKASVVRRELQLYWDDHELTKPSLRRRLAMERSNQAALARALEDVRPDVVSVWNMGAVSLGLLTTLIERRVPLVYAVCNNWLQYGPRMDAWTRLFRRTPRIGAVVRRATGVPTTVPDLAPTGVFCFVSEETRRRAEQVTPNGFPKCTVVYSGIDRRDFPVLPPAEIDGANEWRWSLLFVGRLAPEKGVDVAIRALALLPEQARLRLVGEPDPAHRQRVEALIEELGVAGRVSFEVIERSALAAAYRDADAVLFPSTWAEPFGLVPVEAMACGCPVVASGTGGSAEFLSDGYNCLLATAGDHTALAAAIERLAADPALRTTLRRGGVATASELDITRLTDAFESWHQWAAGGFAGEPPADRDRPSAMRGSAPPRG